MPTALALSPLIVIDLTLVCKPRLCADTYNFGSVLGKKCADRISVVDVFYFKPSRVCFCVSDELMVVVH